MTTSQKIIQNKTENLIGFIKSNDFSSAIMVGLALIIPILIGYNFNLLDFFIPITVGALLASPSDTSGSIRLKLTGILLSSVLATLISFIGGYLHSSIWLFIPMLAALMFSISYLSIFGFRASLISFSGLFALVLSFSNLSESGIPPYLHALLIGAGGLWYIFMAIIYHLIFRRTPTEQAMSHAIKLTANYIELRGKLINKQNNRAELSKDLLQIQIELSEVHETLRELLISSRKGSGTSNYQTKRLLIFIELIEMLELAIAHPVNYVKTDTLFTERPDQMFAFQDLLSSMSQQLNQIAEQFPNPIHIKGNENLENSLQKLKNSIDKYAEEINDPFDDNLLMLRNYFKYQKHQVEKILKIKRLLKNKSQKELNKLRKKDLRNFVTQPDYNLNLLIENFNFNSSIFRHSLRISVITIIGYVIGLLFDLQNSYWILLTIIVIMRPTYGLTKTRSQQRTIGTLIGGAIAVAIVFLVHSTILYATLAIISFVLSFTMLQKNYKSAAAFITLSVVFVYALMEPNIFDVIQFRVIDTLIGTGLAIVGNILLWPAWEIKSFDSTLLDSLRANRKYLKEVANYYNTVGEPSEEYKLSRKQAFLAMSDLSASFQRMAQEPRTRQKNLDKIYEIAMLNHTFLVATASLGTYTINNPTTPASKNFNEVIDHIDKNLSLAEKILVNKTTEITTPTPKEVIQSTYGLDLKGIVNLDRLDDSVEASLKIEEAHLVFELLKWLLSLSRKNLRLLREIDLK